MQAPALQTEESIRAEFSALKTSEVRKRLRRYNVDPDKIFDLDEADDFMEAAIALVLSARQAVPEGLPPDAQSSAPKNVKERLDANEWKTFDDTSSIAWWMDDMAEHINRLRAAARVRDCLPDDYRAQIPSLHPQLVVLGDGNTGKSSVLNRFAGFSFSAVKDGICTRRPVRLQLRPLSAESREIADAEKLEAICQLHDKSDGFHAVFKYRSGHREEDEYSLRFAVESRASAIPPEGLSPSAAFDSQYIADELVITIEADQLIFFDMIDLPGVDNASAMTRTLVRNYINKSTLEHTFVLIFQDAARGDTKMSYSVCQSLIQDVCTEIANDQAWADFMQQRCLGVYTKIDKSLESNSVKDAATYDKDFADKLRSDLNCENHDAHLLRMEWVAVLNPNPEEQLQNMSFSEAARKECWFFEQLFPDEEEEDETRERCGIANFRRKLVGLYEKFVAQQVQRASPTVFQFANANCKRMRKEWAWSPEQEAYDDQAKLLLQLKTMIRECINIGRQRTAKPTSVIDILLRKDVCDTFNSCRMRIGPSAVDDSKQDILWLLASIGSNLIEQVHAATQILEYRCYLAMSEHVVKVTVFLIERFLALVESKLNSVVEDVRKRYEHASLGDTDPLQETLNSLVAAGQSELQQLAAMIESLPYLPTQYIPMGPPDFLLHAKPFIVDVEPPFGFVCDASGRVVASNGDHAAVPIGASIVQIQGSEFNLAKMVELSTGAERVQFACVHPGVSIIPDDLGLAKWISHPEFVSETFLEERERFLCIRRAAETLCLVFNAETEMMQERADFERMIDGRQLICLERDPGADSQWYRRNFSGARPQSQDASATEAFVAEPGFCCAEGCSRTHDTAFNPCGHTVCCWECAKCLTHCPVCQTELGAYHGTHYGRMPLPSRSLCYDYPLTEEDHRKRLQSANERDAERQAQTRAAYERLVITFFKSKIVPAEAYEMLEKRRRELREQPERLPGQLFMWPTYDHLVAEKQRHADELSQEKARAAAELAQEKARAAAELAQEKARAAEAMRTALQEAQAAAACELDRRDVRAKKSCWVWEAAECQAEACTAEFGFTTRRHHCRACGGVFCHACSQNKFEFAAATMDSSKTANGTKSARVCDACLSALQASNGTRSRTLTIEQCPAAPHV